MRYSLFNLVSVRQVVKIYLSIAEIVLEELISPVRKFIPPLMRNFSMLQTISIFSFFLILLVLRKA